MARTLDSLRMHCRTCGLRWKVFQKHQTMDEMCHVTQAFSSSKVACCQGYNKGPYRQEQVQAHLPADAFHIQLWMPLLLRELVLALLRNSQVGDEHLIQFAGCLDNKLPIRNLPEGHSWQQADIKAARQ